MPTCKTCAAEFGAKFKRLLCSKCQGVFCAGHLLPSKSVAFHSKVVGKFASGQGVCLSCLLDIWGKTDEEVRDPRGILGRAAQRTKRLWGFVRGFSSRTPNRAEMVRFSDGAFEALNSSRALAVFRHQKDVSQAAIIQDLTVFARVYAVSQGRATEKSFSLADVYHLVDWMRSHPKIPGWAHGVNWSTIESSPAYFSYLSDIWHVTQTAISLSNPVSAGYHVLDRVLDQTTGKGVFSTGYYAVKDKLGLNVNLKAALLSYLCGQFIIQGLKRRKA